MKRLALLFLFLTSILLFTACASVTTTTNFNKDGSGSKTVTVYARYSDAQYLEGGYEALDQVIKEATPPVLSVEKKDDPDNSRYIYSFTINFTSMEDYKAQMKFLSGEEKEVTWEVTETAFRRQIIYSDEYDSEAMLGWAFDAIDASGISSYKGTEMVDPAASYAYLEDKVVWEGIYSPFFQLDTGIKLNQASIYTSYDLDGKGTKKIELTFDPADFKDIDKDVALSYLEKYSSDFVFDEANSSISVDLANQEAMKTFFTNVAKGGESDYNNEPKLESLVEDTSLFNYTYKIYEEYNLYNLLNEFYTDSKLVNNYISMPETLEFTESYTHGGYKLNTPGPKDYQYQDAFYYSDTYSSSFAAEKAVAITNVDVNYKFEKNMSGTVNTTIDFNKNGCDINEGKFKDFYKDTKDEMSYKETGDNVTVSFIKKFGIGDFYNDGDTFLQYNKSQLSSFTKNIYMFDTVYSINSYLPNMYPNVNYKLSIPDTIKLQFAKLDYSSYYGENLETIHQNGKYNYSFSSSDTAPISLTIEKVNILFYIIVITIIVILLVAAYFLFLFTKKKKRENSNIDNKNTATHSVKNLEENEFEIEDITIVEKPEISESVDQASKALEEVSTSEETSRSDM